MTYHGFCVDLGSRYSGDCALGFYESWCYLLLAGTLDTRAWRRGTCNGLQIPLAVSDEHVVGCYFTLATVAKPSGSTSCRGSGLS